MCTGGGEQNRALLFLSPEQQRESLLCMLLVNKLERSLLAEAKIWAFGLKLSGFDSSSGFKPFLKISAQNTPPIKRKISRRKHYLLVRLQGCHFLTHYSVLSTSAPHPCWSSHPRMSLHRSPLLGSRPSSQWAEPISRVLCSKSGSRTPSRDLPLTALVLLWVPVVNLYFLLSEANLSVIHLASLKPQYKDLAEFCPKKDHSAAHNCSSRGSLNTWLKWKLMKVALNTKFLLAASPSAYDVSSSCRPFQNRFTPLIFAASVFQLWPKWL